MHGASDGGLAMIRDAKEGGGGGGGGGTAPWAML